MQKKNSRYKAIDYIIFFSCLAGAFISGALFWREYNNTLVKINEEPVGVIIFKKRVAQRKFIDRGVWDRLKQASPVYNGDTIRTIEQSEATITLQDEVTHLSLFDSTMIQVFYNSKSGAKIDFSGGDIEVISEHKNTVVSCGTSTIVIAGHARMNKNEEGFFLSVIHGRANVDGMEIEAGNILALDSNGTIDTKPVLNMNLSSPSVNNSGALSGGLAPVVFSWNAFHFMPDTYVIVEAAMDRGFKQIVEARDIFGSSSVSISMKEGNYWWRVYPASAGSREPSSWFYPSGTLEVFHAAEQAFAVESIIQPIPPVFFGKNDADWDDLDVETIANNNRILLQIVLTLNTNSEYKLHIEGHSNPVTNPGNAAVRLREQTRELQPLSETRARTVMNQLLKLGVDPYRLEYRGYGGEHPAAAWEDVKNWHKNRRVEFKLLK